MKLAIEIQDKWEHFNKNTVNPAAEFEPTLLALISINNMRFVNDVKFERNLLDAYMERFLDDYIDKGQSVREWFIDETLTFARQGIDHYEKCILLCMEPKES